jgi:hypothetical protein
MAIGRISGSVLKSNLTRNGTDLAFETNLLYLDVTNSRIGIGTSEPTTALQVNGTVTATTFAGNLTGTVTGNASTATELATARNIAGKSFNGTSDITIASTDLSNTSAIALLTASQTLTNKTLTNPTINAFSGTGNGSITGTLTTTALAVSGSSALDGVTITDNIISTNSSNANLELRANGTGNVGIGTSTPQGRLSVLADDSIATPTMVFQAVNGDDLAHASISTTDDSGGVDVMIGSNIYLGVNGTTQRFDTGRSGSSVSFGYTGTTKFYAGSSNNVPTEVVRISNAGNVGIGTTSPSTALEVSGTIRGSGINVNNAYTLPTSDGSAGQVLTTDGSGTLSFATISVGDFTFNGSTMSAPSNADMTFDNSGTGRYIFEGTSSLAIPNGTTAQRPTGSTGEIRYNSSTDAIEGYTTSGGWAQLGATSSTSENTDDTATGNATAISTTEKIVNQFTTSSFDSAWYLTINRDEINDQVSTAKHSLAHNNSAAVVSSSHMTKSDATNSFVTIDADVTGGNARLKATGTSVVNSLSFYRIALGDNTTAGTTGNVTNVINTDVDSASESIDSWAKASYRAAKYYISVNNASKTEVSNLEALVVHDGTTAYITAYGATNTGSNDLINLTAAIDGSNVVVSATGNEPNLRVTAYRILLADDESASTGDNVNVVAATTVSSTATTVDSFVNSAYTGAFYVFTGYNSTEGAASAAEVMVLSNDEAYIAVGPTISTKGTDQLSFSATQSGSTVTVKAASTSGSSTTVNGYRVHMLRGSAGASTADTVLVSTTQTISGAKTFSSPLALTVGSDPSTATNNAHIYAKDESSSAEVFVRDEAGNVTKISPHNEQGDWEYYSRNTKTGKTVRVNMEEMIRDIEKLTGKKYIKDF